MYDAPARPPHHRLPRRVYRARRGVAVAATVAALLVVYTVVSAVFGDPGRSTQAAPTAPTTSLVESIGTVRSGAATPATSTSTTELKPKEKTVPSAADPAELYIAGDSDAGTFAPYLDRLMKQTGMVKTTLDYKVSSGLSRPDFFNWPAHFAQEIPSVNPDIVVVTFGGNDAQGLRNLDKTWAVQHTPGSGSDDTDWRAEYGKRVGAAMDYLGGDNRTLIWVGIPNDDNPEVTARLQVQNEVVRAEAAKRPKVVFIDTWNRFSGLSGGFAEFVQDPRDGQFKDVRRDDGFHLNETGAEILALDIAEAIRTELRARANRVFPAPTR